MSLALDPLRQHHVLPFRASKAAASRSIAQGGTRIVSIDLLRGAVMVLMALDHARDFFGAGALNPRDVSRARAVPDPLGHAFLRAGVHLSRRHLGVPLRRAADAAPANSAASCFTRGVWMIVLEWTIVRFGWTFSIVPDPPGGAGHLRDRRVDDRARRAGPSSALADRRHRHGDDRRPQHARRHQGRAVRRRRAALESAAPAGDAGADAGLQVLRSLSADPVDRRDGGGLCVRPGVPARPRNPHALAARTRRGSSRPDLSCCARPISTAIPRLGSRTTA